LPNKNLELTEQDFIIRTKELLKDRSSSLVKESNQTIFEIKNKANDQMLIIQLTNELDIWVRLREPNSAYYCESFEELENFIRHMLNDLIEVAIGYKGAEWKETVVVNKNQYSDLNNEYKYIISSWGGNQQIKSTAKNFIPFVGNEWNCSTNLTIFRTYTF